MSLLAGGIIKNNEDIVDAHLFGYGNLIILL
jgi:hypothetical protein